MTQSWKRMLAVAGVAATSVLAPVAHAQTTLDFPTWQAEEPGVSTWWKDLITAYEAKYPGVKVNLQQVPFAQFVKQMTVRFAAGTPPDIVHLPSRDFASFADQGWLEPLDERLRSTDIAANSLSTLMNSQGARAPLFTSSPRPSTMWVCGEIG